MTGIIILAAGSSSRLGTAKQNLIYEGKTLLQRAIDAGITSKADNVVVVLGANADVIRPTIENSPVKIIQNTEWQEGMASSICLGITELKSNGQQINAVILMLCDQPFVNDVLINELIDNQTKKGIIASAYNNTLGAPVLFNEVYFPALLLLKGQEGAKKLLLKHPDDVVAIPFPLGSVDVDTPEDFERLV
jgi:molybdenum cofactor cytidylyltransferase